MRPASTFSTIQLSNPRAEQATGAEKAKICGYLLRKGFRYEDIRQVIQVSDWNA